MSRLVFPCLAASCSVLPQKIRPHKHHLLSSPIICPSYASRASNCSTPLDREAYENGREHLEWHAAGGCIPSVANSLKLSKTATTFLSSNSYTKLSIQLESDESLVSGTNIQHLRPALTNHTRCFSLGVRRRAPTAHFFELNNIISSESPHERQCAKWNDVDCAVSYRLSSPT